MTYDVVIGFDLGHGECASNAMRVNDPTKHMYQLAMNSNGAYSIPTAIAYDADGKVFIGWEAASKPGVIAYFKRNPKEWDATIQGRTVRSLMSDFLRQQMAELRLRNSTAIRPGDRILLLVGCPSSSDWLSDGLLQKYEQLIREATQVDTAMVIPESRAAIYSTFSRFMDKKVNTQNGAAVFDFGSSTADFTYLKLADSMIERSWTLGAVEIERIMFQKTLEQAGLSLGNVWSGEVITHELNLREAKERYFDNTGSNLIGFSLAQMDKSGNPIVAGVKKNGYPEYLGRPVTLTLSEQFMDMIVNENRFRATENGRDVGTASWAKHCKDFFVRMNALLKGKGLPCETIILAGGASRMPFVRESCQEVFRQEVHVISNPSTCVSLGLCYVGMTELEIPELRQKTIAKVKEQARKDVEIFANHCSLTLGQYIYGKVRDQLQPCGHDITVGELSKRIEDNVTSQLTPQIISQLIQRDAEAWLERNRKSVVQATNDAVKELYPDKMTREAFKVDASIVDLALTAAQFSITPSALLGQLKLIGPLMKAIAESIYYAFLFAMAWIPGVGVLILVLISLAGTVIKEKILEWISTNKDHVLNVNRQSSIEKDYRSKAAEHTKNLQAAIEKAILSNMTECYGEGYQELCEKLGAAQEKAFDIVSLKYFEHVEN